MNKKAKMITTLAGLILVLVSMLLMIMIFGNLSSQTQWQEEQACRNSVILRSMAEFNYGPLNFQRLTPLACSSYDEGVLEGDRAEVKGQVADLMARCWYMYYDGQSEKVFDEERADSCAICYTFGIPDDLEPDPTPSNRQIFEEPDITEEVVRTATIEDEDVPEGVSRQIEQRLSPDMISAAEMYNHLFLTTYAPGALRGGDIGNYISNVHTYEGDRLREVQENTVRLSLIEFEAGFLQDFTEVEDSGRGIVSADTQAMIAQLGSRLVSEGVGNLQVIVAQDLDTTQRFAVRSFIESKELDTQGRLDAIVLLLDIEDRTVRVAMGAELERYISEPLLGYYLEQNFYDIHDEIDFNNRLQSFISQLSEDLKNPSSGIIEELNLHNSYYAYLSNGGIQHPFLQDMHPGRSYGVAFVTNGHGWTTQMYSWVGGAVAGGAATGAILSIATGPVGWTLGAVALGAGAVVGTGSASVFEDIRQWLEGENPNDSFILVGPMSELGEMCERI